MSKKKLARAIGVCTMAISIIVVITILPSCESSPTPPTYGLEFDGEDDYVGIGQPESLNITGEITFAAWVKAEDDAGKHTVISCGYAYMINAPYNGLVEFYSNDGTLGSGCSVNWNYDNEWIHVVAVCRPYAGSWTTKGYVNAEEVCSKTAVNFTGHRAIGEIVDIGRRGGANDRFFKGLISEVRIYNGVLSDEEIQNVYRHQDITNGLVGYWKLNEGSGIIAHDSTANNNHGTLESDPVWFGGGG